MRSPFSLQEEDIAEMGSTQNLDCVVGKSFITSNTLAMHATPQMWVSGL